MSTILLVGCDKDCICLQEKVEDSTFLHATTLEEAALILREHLDISLVVVDCRRDVVETSIATARTLRQEGFLSWMIAVCTRSDTKEHLVKTEYDLSCSEDEVCDMVSSLV